MSFKLNRASCISPASPTLGPLVECLCNILSELHREALRRNQQMEGPPCRAALLGPALFLQKGGKAAIMDSPGDCKPH